MFYYNGLQHKFVSVLNVKVLVMYIIKLACEQKLKGWKQSIFTKVMPSVIQKASFHCINVDIIDSNNNLFNCYVIDDNVMLFDDLLKHFL